MAIDKLSKFNIGKGIVGGHRFAVWDYIGPCQGDECVIHDVCTYKDAKPTSDRQTKKCGIERYYMSVVFKPFADLVDKLKDPFVMQWVGLHIIPLYHQLIKLKKFERSLASPIDISSKGDARIHPVLKEIRAVISAIRTEWRMSGLMEAAKDEGYLSGSFPEPLDTTDLEGDAGYHDSLYVDEEEE